MTTPHEYLIDQLGDAHALEEQAKTLIKTQIDRLESYPEYTTRLRQHLDETEGQRARVERCLLDLGSNTSGFKDATTKLMANLQGMGHMMTNDEVLKNALASHAFERFEAASYHSLAAAANVAGEHRVAAMAQEIQREEEAMGDWIWKNIPMLTEKYLARSERSETAKA